MYKQVILKYLHNFSLNYNYQQRLSKNITQIKHNCGKEKWPTYKTAV